MNDEELLHAFHQGSLTPTGFHHRDHLHLTWTLIQRHGEATAMRVICAGIQRLATLHGHAEKYHETLTRFWVRAVALHLAQHPEMTSFDEFIAVCPQLLDKDLPYRHWRRETMTSAQARAHWVEPDLLALPQ
jgi:hypothetical protein